MAEDVVRPPERPPEGNGNQRAGQPNGHHEAPISHQEDVFLDIPKLEVDKIEVNVANLRARVSLNAEVLSLLRLSVGVDAAIDQVHLLIEGVEAEAQLKVRLDNVAHIIDRVLATLDSHPEIIQPLVENAGQAIGQAGRGIESAVTDTGRGAGRAVGELGAGASDLTRDVGRGAGDATREIGGGAGQATRSVGEGAGDATRSVGDGAGQATRSVGEGAGQATSDVGEGAGQAVGGVADGAGQAVGGVRESASQATGGVADGAGQAVGGVGESAGQAAGGAGQAAGDVAEGAGQAAGDAGESGKQVTDHAAQADLGDGNEPDISAESTVAADEKKDTGDGAAEQPRRSGLPRRKPRSW